MLKMDVVMEVEVPAATLMFETAHIMPPWASVVAPVSISPLMYSGSADVPVTAKKTAPSGWSASMAACPATGVLTEPMWTPKTRPSKTSAWIHGTMICAPSRRKRACT